MITIFDDEVTITTPKDAEEYQTDLAHLRDLGLEETAKLYKASFLWISYGGKG